MRKTVIYKTKLDNNGLPVCVKEREVEYGSIIEPGIAAAILRNAFDIGNLAEEHVYEICMDASGRPVGIFEVSCGSIDFAIVDPKIVFRNALMVNAVSVILSHNHPSGDLSPSKEDRALYARLKKGGDILQIKVLDFLIQSEDNYVALSTSE